KYHEFHVNLTREIINPDCHTQGYERLVVNGQSPGPAIRVTKNDLVRVVVHNGADEPTSLHFHGIFQIGTTEADGMPNVTQAAIPPGGTFTQLFRVIDQVGTYYYHAHSDLQDVSVNGPLIVYESEESWPEHNHDGLITEGSYTYDDERIIMLSEHWHQTDEERFEYIMGEKFEGMIAADSYLLNGRSIFHNTIPRNSTTACPGYPVIDVEHGKTYRIRVIGSLTFASLGLIIADHTMTVIEVDGGQVEPYVVPYLEVAPGQRFSILVKADQIPKDYWVDTDVYQLTQTDTTPARAVLHYISEKPRSKQPPPLSDLPQFPPGPNQWYFQSLQPAASEKQHRDIDFSIPPDRTLVILPVEFLTAENTTRWRLNGHQPAEWDTPLINLLEENPLRIMNETAIELAQEGLSDGFDEATQTYPFNQGEVVDIVMHSTVLFHNAICAGHPWHSHGMVHYAIAHGSGEYIHARDKDIRTYPTPIPKDLTFVYSVPPSKSDPVGTPCGWTKMRFYMTNPGLWGFHCHINGHMMQGMVTVMQLA
ncbi:Cupredoxin, partial [Dichotomocladium elegans]